MFDKNQQIVIVCTLVIMVLFFLWRRRQRGERFNSRAFLYARLIVILAAIIILGIETMKSWNLVKVLALLAAGVTALYIYKQYSNNDEDDKGSDH
ncbi:MAG: hypothetical protein SGJ10_13290 [Bacteroidota bacterium]|nr:hypothetical protein [Bacteroidota bacterium]